MSSNQWFIDKILVGFMHPVILSAECECIGENYIGWVSSETADLPSSSSVRPYFLIQSYAKPSIPAL